MKETFRRIGAKILSNDFIWRCCSPVFTLATHLRHLRTYYQQLADKERILGILKTPVVKNGPFKGLIYPPFSTEGTAVYPKLFGSAIYPKIIGCYEAELHPFFDKIIASKNYSEILDVGSAEGYYVNGLALRCPRAKVFAYDIIETERNYCRQIAVLNNVQDRVTINAACTPEILATFPFTGKGLIISDCEGYEKVLFSRQNIKALANCDILIEVHDFIDIEISDYLRNLFSETHTITTIRSVDDVEMARTYSYPETDGLDLNTKKLIFQETRPCVMDWFWIEAKSSS